MFITHSAAQYSTHLYWLEPKKENVVRFAEKVMAGPPHVDVISKPSIPVLAILLDKPITLLR